MVSVFEGQLMRTWSYSLAEDLSTLQSATEEKKRPKKHVINLYHDTITGDTSYPLSRVPPLPTLSKIKHLLCLFFGNSTAMFRCEQSRYMRGKKFFDFIKNSLNGSNK